MRAVRLTLALLACVLLAACSAYNSNANNSANAPAAVTRAATSHPATVGAAPALPASTAGTAMASAGAVRIPTADPSNRTLLLATTTSTQDSGLLDVLIPLFEQQTGYQVKVQAVGSGQAMALGAAGNADVLLVHSPAAELQSMAQNQGINRRLVMHNDFVIVGPASDPAHIKGMSSALASLKAIAAARATFISRGDNSGTNALELQLWQQTGINPKGQSWYLETGTGMGDTLNVTAQKNGYTISDRATYLATQKQTQLSILVEKDPVLLNIYHVIQVNPANHTGINVAGAQAFSDWIVSPPIQQVIANFGKDQYGQALFVADAGKSESELSITPTPAR